MISIFIVCGSGMYCVAAVLYGAARIQRGYGTARRAAVGIAGQRESGSVGQWYYRAACDLRYSWVQRGSSTAWQRYGWSRRVRLRQQIANAKLACVTNPALSPVIQWGDTVDRRGIGTVIFIYICAA